MERKRGKGPALKFPLWLLIVLINIFLFTWLIFSLDRFWNLIPEVSYKPIASRVKLMETADFDGDYTCDVATIYPEEPYPMNNVLSVFSPFSTSSVTRFKYLFERLVLAGGTVIGTLEYGPEKKPHLAVITQKGPDLSVSVFARDGSTVKNVSINSIFQTGQQIASSPLFYELNGDGSPELIFALESSWSGKPRGVLAVDIENGRVLWKFLMGCSVMDLRLLDVNADGREEIIVSGRSPHNGVSVNGLDDDHSYLICLDAGGKPLWIQQLGWYFTRLFIDTGDLDGDGRPELVVAKTCDRVDRPEPGELRILDPATGATRLRYTREGTSFSMVHIVRTSGQGGAILAVGNDRGEVQLFDENLELQKTVQLEKPAVIHGVFGLGNGDGKYIYVQAGFSRFYLMDLNLKRQNKFELSEPVYLEDVVIKPVRNRDELAILLNADRLYLISRKPVFALKELRRGMGLMLVVMVVHIILFNTLVLLLSRRRFAALATEDRRQNQWLELAQEVAHWMKNPMFTIGLESEKIKYLAGRIDPGEVKEKLTGAASAILEDVSRLNEQIKIFMKLVAQRPMKFESVDLNELLRRLVRRYEEVIGQRVSFRLNLDEEKAVVRGDEEQLNEAFTNIISNAVEAIEEKLSGEKSAKTEKGPEAGVGPGGEKKTGSEMTADLEAEKEKGLSGSEESDSQPEQVSGWIKISTTVVYSPVWRKRKGVLVEIEDNGPGMDEETISKIFQPYFTTKENGMGIGLTLSKKIVEAHGGRIEVYSRPGIGTRFAVFLPV